MPEISAQGAALMEADSGRIIFSKNKQEKLKMASTTKVMTGLLAIEKKDLNEKVKASHEASEVEGSSIYLKKGEKLTLEEMLYGLMLESGNDSAHAIAEHIAGNIEGFNILMNERARKIGAISTNFQNPHGLPAKDHYTTAKDLTKISRKAMKNPVFERIVSTKRKVIPGPGEEMNLRFLSNTNKFIDNYPGADGVKTGWTKKAGRCLVFSASRNGVQIIGTLLDAPQMYEDAEKLLDWAFSEYDTYKILNKDQVVGELAVDKSEENIMLVPTQDVEMLINDTEKNSIDYILKPEEELYPPIVEGEKVGDLQVNINGETVHKVAVKSANEIQREGVIYSIINFFRNLF